MLRVKMLQPCPLWEGLLYFYLVHWFYNVYMVYLEYMGFRRLTLTLLFGG